MLTMWEKIMIPMYRLWLQGVYGLCGPCCPLSPERPFNLITHSVAPHRITPFSVWFCRYQHVNSDACERERVTCRRPLSLGCHVCVFNIFVSRCNFQQKMSSTYLCFVMVLPGWYVSYGLVCKGGMIFVLANVSQNHSRTCFNARLRNLDGMSRM